MHAGTKVLASEGLGASVQSHAAYSQTKLQRSIYHLIHSIHLLYYATALKPYVSYFILSHKGPSASPNMPID